MSIRVQSRIMSLAEVLEAVEELHLPGAQIAASLSGNTISIEGIRHELLDRGCVILEPIKSTNDGS